VSLALYYSNGWLARMFWGAQSRLMDGSLARANCLLITTLWSVFKFVMVPIGIRLQAHFGPEAYAPLFILIWGSYVTGDALSEIVGALIGKQRLRVWGLGDVNRKSVAGTWACFLGSLALCVWVVAAHGLPRPWLGLALVLAVSNTVFELVSPRGTDDFTMATANALLCSGSAALPMGKTCTASG
jgi:dolichol kinase